MSNSSDINFDDFPQTLDLLDAVVPAQRLYKTAQGRVFVTVVEYWNIRTSFRLVFPVAPLLNPREARMPRVLDLEGNDYGMSSAGGGGGDLTWDMHFSTARPIPQGLDRVLLDLNEVKVEVVIR